MKKIEKKNEKGRKPGFKPNKKDEKPITSDTDFQSRLRYLANLSEEVTVDRVFDNYSSILSALGIASNRSFAALMNILGGEGFIRGFKQYKVRHVLSELSKNAFFYKKVNQLFESCGNEKSIECCLQVILKILEFNERTTELFSFEKMKALLTKYQSNSAMEKLVNYILGMQQANLILINEQDLMKSLLKNPKIPNFRQTPILPTYEEIFDANVDLYSGILPNIIGKQWPEQFSELYLDTQFHLLRIDFVAPLKEAVNSWLQNDSKRQRGVFWNLQYASFKFAKHRVPTMVFKSHKAKFPVKGSQLKSGSLVALFQVHERTPVKTSIVFSTISASSESELELLVSPVDITRISLTASYALIESPCYFRAVEPILKWIKTARWDEIHLGPALLTGNVGQSPPRYLENSVVDVRCLLNSTLMPAPVRLNPLKLISGYPLDISKDLCLDESQAKALEIILSSKISLVVGPPGTGKSYVGIKACQIIKRCLDSRYNPSPILVIAYTNHALDQVLLELIDEYPDLVRFGSRCKSEKLAPRSIYNISSTGNRETYSIRDSIHALDREFKIASTLLEMVEQNDLSDVFPSAYWEKTLLPLIDVLKEEHSAYAQSMKKEYIMAWKTNLLISYYDKWRAKFSPKTGKAKKTLSTANAFDSLRDLGDKEIGDVLYDSDSDDEGSIASKLQSKPAAKVIEENEDDEWTEIQKLEDDEVEQFKPVEYDFAFMSIREEKSVLLSTFNYQISVFLTDKGITDFDKVPFDLRAELYNEWKMIAKQLILSEIERLMEDIEELQSRLGQLNDLSVYEATKDAPIIGMTSTFAALHRQLIDKLSPCVCLIEEAGELLESQVLACMSSRSMEHLILIGDHKQLRPKVNDYKLAKEYNFDISMFERLISLNMRHSFLKTQHRMRPEICDLVRPFYEDLKDHDVVKSFERVKGVLTNVFFFDHAEPEDPNNSVDFVTKRNSFEARMAVNLASYLMKQEYSSEEITILTPYLGQKRLLRSLIEEVKVATIDDFQGEENKIIILSLVRSNEEMKSGFVSVENRAIVALSRAREGCFIIGNGKQIGISDSWKSTIALLKSRNQFGKAFSLVCERHKDQATMIRTVDDFGQVVDGGCSTPCDSMLECGHVCSFNCHLDKLHYTMKCRKPCARSVCEHQCGNLCCNCQTHTSFTCTTSVSVTMPGCLHLQNVECNEKGDLSSVKCLQPIVVQLKCGHKREIKCFEPKDRVACTFKDQVVANCGHLVKRECFTVKRCHAPCSAVLTCNHPCDKLCSNIGHSHSCNSKCRKKLICGHFCQNECKNPVHTSECKLPCDIKCSHAKCPKLCYEKCVECKEVCHWRCDHFKCTKKCFEDCDRPRCNRRCKKPLRCCKRRCHGLCGEICPPCPYCNPEVVCPLSLMAISEMAPEDRLYVLPDCHCVFLVDLLDAYMQTEAVNEKHVVITLKKCPKCQVSIQTAWRYSVEIRKQRKRVNSVKALISQETLKMVAAAMKSDISLMSVGDGRWYACPNNHPYFIGDCGGPTQVSKCPECKERIGGSNHALLKDNLFRPEIDNAIQPAWPTTMSRV